MCDRCCTVASTKLRACELEGTVCDRYDTTGRKKAGIVGFPWAREARRDGTSFPFDETPSSRDLGLQSTRHGARPGSKNLSEIYGQGFPRPEAREQGICARAKQKKKNKSWYVRSTHEHPWHTKYEVTQEIHAQVTYVHGTVVEGEHGNAVKTPECIYRWCVRRVLITMVLHNGE